MNRVFPQFARYVSVIVGAVFILGAVHVVDASNGSIWVNDNQLTMTKSVYKGSADPPKTCAQEKGQLIKQDGSSETKDLCITFGSSLNLATYRSSNGHDYFAVKFAGDSLYRTIRNVTSYNTRLYFLPEMNMIIKHNYTFNLPRSVPSLGYYISAANAFKPGQTTNSGAVYTYDLDDSSLQGMFKYTSGSSGTLYARPYGWTMSSSGRYVVSNVDYNAFVLVNLASGTERAVQNSGGSLYGGYTNPKPGAVTDDGRYVYVGGSDRFIDTNECGSSYQSWLSDHAHFVACPSRYVRSDIIATLGYNFDANQYVFKDDGYTLEFIAHTVGNYSGLDKVTIKATGYKDTRLDYLALGDSYSSGEGDVLGERGAHYIAGAENGGCHLSDRSYPFLLRDFWNIDITKMKSVACSGAKVLPDYIAPIGNYPGQRGELVGSNALERNRRQMDAINDFSPGIVPQIEFVKKYQPRVLTLTGGGNDVGFAEIMKYCATPTWEGLFVDDTCGYAKEGSELQGMLMQSIDTQYTYSKLLIEKLKQASPRTHIIIVSYPSFVASSIKPCFPNGGSLNPAERDMINEAMTRMNQMLQRVAYDTSVSFVNIEDSLDGGRICEGSKYVTGIVGLAEDDLLNGRFNESFHPNSRGHLEIAKRILDSGVYNDSQVTEKGIFDRLFDGGLAIFKRMTEVTFSKSNGIAEIKLDKRALQPFAPVSVSIFSEKQVLYTGITNNDGSLRQNIDLENIPPGRHVLVVDGISYSGEPLKYYEFIELRASDTDADMDGIPDESDNCTFFTSWIDEETGQDVCVQVFPDQPSSIVQEPNIAELNGTTGERLGTGLLQPTISNSQTAFRELSMNDHYSYIISESVLGATDTEKSSLYNDSGESSIIEQSIVCALGVCGIIVAISIYKLRKGRE